MGEWINCGMSTLAPLLCNVLGPYFAIPWTIQPMEFSRPEHWSTGVGSHSSGTRSTPEALPSLGVLPNPGIKPRSPTLQTDSLPAEPPGKPKNTGVGSLLLLQWVFRTQESNQGLLHCRWILYQLRYQGSPHFYNILKITEL